MHISIILHFPMQDLRKTSQPYQNTARFSDTSRSNDNIALHSKSSVEKFSRSISSQSSSETHKDCAINENNKRANSDSGERKNSTNSLPHVTLASDETISSTDSIKKQEIVSSNDSIKMQEIVSTNDSIKTQEIVSAVSLETDTAIVVKQLTTTKTVLETAIVQLDSKRIQSSHTDFEGILKI